MRPSNANPRYETTFATPELKNLSDPGSWEQAGGTFVNVDAAQWGQWNTGPGFVYADPYAGPYDVPEPREPIVLGDTGFNALLVMGLVWIAYEYANKRMSR